MLYPGHEALLAGHIRILHRDISAQNVLLGREGAPPGERGILIDLDLAFRATEEKPTAKVDYNIVSLPFLIVHIILVEYYLSGCPYIPITQCAGQPL